MDEIRRALLKGVGASGALWAAIVAGALKPSAVLAADWNVAAFNSKSIAGALRAMGIVNPIESAEIVLKAPDVAEDGAVVPLEVSCNLANTQKLSILIDNNPNPLAAHFELSGGALPALALRVKMRQTSNVRVVAHVDGKFYFAVKEIVVTVGGCGG